MAIDTVSIDNVIMIHVSKTGGTSLMSILWPGITVKHHFASRYPADEWARCFTFGFVRNPYDRMASAYTYICGHRYKGALRETYPNLRELSFEKFLRQIIIPSDQGFAAEQVKVLTHPLHGIVDFVGRFENYQKDANYILDSLDRKERVPHLNKNSATNYSSLLGKNEKKLIEGRFWKDFEAFNY